MAQYDNNEPSLWYKAGGQSQNTIAALVNGTLTPQQKVAALRSLGVLDHLAVQVYTYGDLAVRAYETSAVLWADPSLPDTFYFECPVDYKGRHYAPSGATRLDDAQTHAVNQSLFHGGWGDSIPLTANFIPRMGTHLPRGFNPQKHKTIESGLFNTAYFSNKAIYRANDALYVTLLRYAAQNDIDPARLPQTIASDNNTAIAPLTDKAGDAPPAVWRFPEGLYFVYDGAVPKNPGLIPVKPAEYVWMRLNKDDRELGIRPPEPPKTLEKLYVPGVFLASGVSHDLLDHDYKTQHKVFTDIRAFKDKIFGQTAAFNTASSAMESYGQRPMEEWLKGGTFKGFRFDWEPLNAPGRARYAIPAQPVPQGWIPVTGHA
jgi:hypothetical protein